VALIANQAQPILGGRFTVRNGNSNTKFTVRGGMTGFTVTRQLDQLTVRTG
jgi:hypothetical protein